MREFHIPPPPVHVLHAFRHSTGEYLGIIYQATDRRGRVIPLHNRYAAGFLMIANGPYVRAESPEALDLTWTMQ